MAITVSNVDANIEAARAAAKPSFMALNVLDDQPSTPTVMGSDKQWQTLAAQAGGGSDITDANFPTSLVDDRNLNVGSRPGSGISVATVVYLHFEVIPGTDDAHTIDSVMIAHENLHQGPGTISVTVEFDDDPNYATAVTATTFASVTTGEKLIDLTLGDGDDQYTNVRYIRLTITSTVAFGVSYFPSITECVFGKRRQMAHHPVLKGFDPDQQDSKLRILETDSGFQNRHQFASRRAVLNTRWKTTTQSLTGIDEHQVLLDLFEDSDGFSNKFLYVDAPLGDVSSLPAGHWMNPDPQLSQVLQGPSDYLGRVMMTEDPPFKSTET
ncbi:MAG: hypothetical protein GTO22_14545 [Gemmatimonadales bacterium]|nr:hypothetical protein [Gemmatimonadales bacterium]